MTGALVVNNFANPITFLCGAIQAASRLDAEQSSKLCVQYLAPIIKNRQYNYPADRRELLRRHVGPAERGHLQRRLDAARLRAAGNRASGRCTAGRRRTVSPSRGPLATGWGSTAGEHRAAPCWGSPARR